jgi:hypothetical protein
MANSLYNSAAYAMATGTFDWTDIPLVLSAWAGTPTFDATHLKIADIKALGSVELGWSLPITAQSVAADGTMQTNHVVIPTVPIGQNVTWFTMSGSQGIHDNNRLIMFIDHAKELPFVPNGLDLLVTPDWLAQRGWGRA